MMIATATLINTAITLREDFVNFLGVLVTFSPHIDHNGHLRHSEGGHMVVNFAHRHDFMIEEAKATAFVMGAYVWRIVRLLFLKIR